MPREGVRSVNVLMLLADSPALQACDGRPAIEWRCTGFGKGELRRLAKPRYVTRVEGALGAEDVSRSSLRVRLADDGAVHVEADGEEVYVGCATPEATERDVVCDLQRRLDTVLLWEHRLHAEALAGADFSRTLEVGRELIGRDLVLFDVGFAMVAYSSAGEPYLPSLAHMVVRGYAPPMSQEHMARYFALEEASPNGFELTYVQPAEGEDVSFAGRATGMAQAVWVREVRTRRGGVYRLHAVEVCADDQATIALIDCLAESLRAQLERHEAGGGIGLNGGFIEELVTGACGSDEAASRALSFGLRPQDVYRAVRVQSLECVYPQLRWEGVRQRLVEQVAGARGACMDEGVALLVPCGAIDDELPDALSDVAVREQVWMGVGDVAEGVGNVPTSYRQACTAVALGGRARERACQVVFYDDCKVVCACRALEEANADDALVPSSVLAARRHDAAHGTDYERTLMTYYRCGKSKADTCKRLFIHRNTLEHRLARAGELFGVDFADDDFHTLMTLLAASSAGK